MDNNYNKLKLFNVHYIEYIKSAFFLYGLLFALLIWIVEPFIDVIFFDRGPLYNQFFNPDTHEFYMRLIISSVIIIYSFIGSILLVRSKQLNLALQTSERSLGLFVDNAPAAIALFDNDMKYIAYSRRYLHDFKLGDQNLIGRSHYDIFPEAPASWKVIHQRCLSGHSEKCDDDSFVRLNGKKEWTRWEIHPWYKEENEVGGIIFFCEVITEKKKGEIEKSHTFELINQVINSTQDLIFVKDANLRTILCNQTFADAVNKKPEELYGNTDLENGWTVEHVKGNPEKGIRGYENDDKEVLSGKFLNIESEVVHINNETRFFNTIKSPLKDSDSNIIGILAISRDITESTKTKNALQASEQRFRSLIEATTSIIWSANNNGEFTTHQASWEKFTGQPWEEHKGFGWTKAIHPEDVEHIITGWKEAIKNIHVHHDSGRIWNKQLNEWRSFEVNATPVINENNSIREWVGFITDITERKLSEEALRTSERKYRTLIEYSPYCIHQIDQNNLFISMNAAGLKMLGLKNESEILGKSYLDTVCHDDKRRIAKIIDAAFSGEAQEYEFCSVDGLEFRSNFVPIYNLDKKIERLLGITQDITERKAVERKLNYQATHDNLTGLINRQEFERRAERLLSTIALDQKEHALCFMDLDQFKIINDTCGHIAGDEMLRQLSSVLQTVVRKRDTLARLGGDEFGVLMEHCPIEDATRVATSLQNAIQDHKFVWEEHTFKVSASIGLVSINETTINLTELLKDADAACYRSKETGRNRIHIFHPDDSDIINRKGEMRWVERINHAVEHDMFCLYAQKIEPMSNNEGTQHYELLIRMLDEDDTTILPGTFLPSAERYDLMPKIDAWVINKSFDLLSTHSDFLADIDFCSINLSGQSLSHSNILELIISRFNYIDFPANKICFEITETSAISNLSKAIKFISTLKGLGCRFALDDFGSGLSSFGYLKSLPVDYLKIDGMFVKDIVDDKIDFSMVKSINEIGHVMGMQTIAEFVENDVIKGMLKDIRVDYAQGYGIGKPQAFEDLLISSRLMYKKNFQ